MNNNIEIRKPIDEEYRIEAARLLREWAEKKSVSMNPAIIDDNTVKALFRKVEGPVKKAMYYYAKRRRMLEVTRIVPNHAVEGLLRRQTRDVGYYDMPREYLNITVLVPDWKDIVARALLHQLAFQIKHIKFEQKQISINPSKTEYYEF